MPSCERPQTLDTPPSDDSSTHFRKDPRPSNSTMRDTCPSGHSDTQWKSHGLLRESPFAAYDSFAKYEI